MQLVALTPPLTLALALATAAWSSGSAQPAATTANPERTVVVRLSSFAFDPEHVRLQASVPVRLQLVNESGGGHNFSAPAFFAASTVLPGSAIPQDGKVEVGAHQTVTLALVPRTPGHYPLYCARTSCTACSA